MAPSEPLPYLVTHSEALLDDAAELIADGDFDGAIAAYLEVQQIGGKEGLHASIGLAELYLGQGEPERADALFEQVRHDPLLDEDHCLSAGEGFELRGDLLSAERWLNRGAALLTEEQLADFDDPDSMLSVAAMLLGSRRVVRGKLGRAPDLLDERANEELGDPLQRMRYANRMLHDLVAEELAAAPEQTPGRNAPCPCGSGRKYKKCCGSPA